MKTLPKYKFRFIKESQYLELINLFNIARVAMAGNSPTIHDRMIYAAAEFHKAHPEVSPTGAYKDLYGAYCRF